MAGEKSLGDMVERRAAASAELWFGRLRGDRALLVEINKGEELLESDIVEERDESEEDLVMISRSSL